MTVVEGSFDELSDRFLNCPDVIEDMTVCQDRDERNDSEKILGWKNKILFF